MKLRIATRNSRLALWQAHHVRTGLMALGHTVELVSMTTKGDQILDQSLSKIGGKGLFIKELETALMNDQADLAVHSLKDVPMQLPTGFQLVCVMARENPADAWVSPHHANLEQLPHGAVIGTSSLRREVLLKEKLQSLGREDVVIQPLRGNLDTRLAKLDAGDYQAIVLAKAGLVRLDLAHRIQSEWGGDWLGAPGQGALGIEIRADRMDVQAVLHPLMDQPTWWATMAEREVSRQLGGSCQVPLGAHAQWNDHTMLHLQALWANAKTMQQNPMPAVLRYEHYAMIQCDEDAVQLGKKVAQGLRDQGAMAM